MIRVLGFVVVVVGVGCGSAPDWLGGGVHPVKGKAGAVEFTIDIPDGMTSRPNALGVRSYLSVEEPHFGPWIDVESTTAIPQKVDDMLNYANGADVAAKQQEPDGSWMMVTTTGGATPTEVRVLRWVAVPGGKNGLWCNAYQEAEKSVASPDKVRARLEQACRSLKHL